jgi:hypothetical protein
MTSGLKFEARLRVALMEAAEREERRSRPLKAVAAIPPLLRAKTASVPTLIGAAVAVVAVAGALVFGALLSIGPHQTARPLPEPKVLTRLQVSESLGSAVTGFGSLWLDDTTHDEVLRLDLHTRRVIARIPVRGEATAAVGGTALWVLQAGGSEAFNRHGPLLRVDPRTNRVTARIPLRTPAGRPFVAYDVVAAPDDVWVWGPSGALRIDPRTSSVTNAIQLPRSSAEANGFAIWHGALWAMTGNELLLEFDPRTGAKRSQVPLPSQQSGPTPSSFGLAGDAVIVAPATGLERIEPLTGRVLWRAPIGEVPGQWAEERGLIWAVSSGAPHDRLSALDPDTGRVVTSTTLTDFGATGVVAADGKLWLTLANGKVVLIRP